MRGGVLAALLGLAACEGTSPQKEETFSQIAPGETVHFTGTEPFWSGEAAEGAAVWKTPENIEGTQFAVTRFAGNNGVSFSGEVEGEPFDLMVTPGQCSDGMSDFAYPYHATVSLGDARYRGCAWTDRQSRTGGPIS